MFMQCKVHKSKTNYEPKYVCWYLITFSSARVRAYMEPSIGRQLQGGRVIVHIVLFALVVLCIMSRLSDAASCYPASGRKPHLPRASQHERAAQGIRRPGRAPRVVTCRAKSNQYYASQSNMNQCFPA